MIDALNKHLPLELNAHLIYAGQSAIFSYRGYTKLADHYKDSAKEEMGHAQKVMKRIQQLGGWPDYVPDALPVKGQSKWSVRELFEANLATEQKVLDSLTKLIQAADEDEQDWETDNVLRTLVSDTEDDIQFYTAQLAQIEEIGLQNYLAAQL